MYKRCGQFNSVAILRPILTQLPATTSRCLVDHERRTRLINRATPPPIRCFLQLYRHLLNNLDTELNHCVLGSWDYSYVNQTSGTRSISPTSDYKSRSRKDNHFFSSWKFYPSLYSQFLFYYFSLGFFLL
jgi:hypothetical protein